MWFSTNLFRQQGLYLNKTLFCFYLCFLNFNYCNLKTNLYRKMCDQQNHTSEVWGDKAWMLKGDGLHERPERHHRTSPSVGSSQGLPSKSRGQVQLWMLVGGEGLYNGLDSSWRTITGLGFFLKYINVHKI